MREERPNTPARDPAGVGEDASDATVHRDSPPKCLVSLKATKREFKVAEDDPDIRGWDVRTSDDVLVGKVDDLIVDTSALKVRYMTVKIDRHVFGAERDRCVLIPIGEARLDLDADDVWVNLDAVRLAALPEYDARLFDRVYEDAVRSHFDGSASEPGRPQPATDDYYEGRHFDLGRFFASRRGEREDEGRIAPADE